MAERAKVIYEPGIAPPNCPFPWHTLDVRQFGRPFNLPVFVTTETVEHDIERYKPRPNDYVVATYPKCGTTWVQAICIELVHGGISEGHSIEEYIPWLECNTGVQRLGAADFDSLSEDKIRLLKSHLPYDLIPKGAKYIYVARNAKDAAVSWYHFARALPLSTYAGDWNTFADLFLHGDVGFDSWFDNLAGWYQQKDNENVLFLTYEGMKKDIQGSIRRINAFLGLPSLSDERVQEVIKKTSFQHMQDNIWMMGFLAAHKPDETTFFRKGVVGDWKNHFTPEQAKAFDDLYDLKLSFVDPSLGLKGGILPAPGSEEDKNEPPLKKQKVEEEASS